MTYRIRQTAWLANCLNPEERLEVATWLRQQGATEEAIERLKENVCFTFDLSIDADGKMSIEPVAMAKRKSIYGEVARTAPGRPIDKAIFEELQALIEGFTVCKQVYSKDGEPGIYFEVPIEDFDSYPRLKAQVEAIGFRFRETKVTANTDGSDAQLAATIVLI